MNWNQPMMLLDENTSSSSGGAPGVAPASSTPSGEAGGASPPTQIPRTPDSPDEPSDSLAGMEENDFDAIELPEEVEQVGEAGAAPLAPPPAAQPQPATAPQPGAPQAAPAQQQAPKQDAQQPPRSALDQAIEGFRTNHAELSKWASTNLFALSKEDAELLETDAVSAIPVLMGRVYSQALQATSNLIKNFVPNMVNEGVTTNNARAARANEALNEFYQANPHLSADKHGGLVDKWARAFRAANPSASRADAIKFVGNAVSTELGIAPAQAGAGNGAQRRPAPFAPARPGVRSPAPSKPRDPYEGMDMDFDQE